MDYIVIIILCAVIGGGLIFTKRVRNIKERNIDVKLTGSQFKLAESKNYIIISQYESVFLIIKRVNKTVNISDFYGDAEVAIISDDESFCVMGGCGLIIYYLHEPYQEYSYNTTTTQWKELFRDKEQGRWIEEIKQLDSSSIIINLEDGSEFKVNTNSLDFVQLA